MGVREDIEPSPEMFTIIIEMEVISDSLLEVVAEIEDIDDGIDSGLTSSKLRLKGITEMMPMLVARLKKLNNQL